MVQLYTPVLRCIGRRACSSKSGSSSSRVVVDTHSRRAVDPRIEASSGEDGLVDPTAPPPTTTDGDASGLERDSLLNRAKRLVRSLDRAVTSTSIKDQEDIEKTYPDYLSRPLSTHYQNIQNRPYDPDVSLSQRWKGGKMVLKEETAKLKSKLHETFVNFDPSEAFGCQFDGETLVQWDFKQRDSRDAWKVGSDADLAQGYSTGRLHITPHNTALFTGNLSTIVPKSGLLERAGWAAVKTKTVSEPFYLKRASHKYEWSKFTHLVLKVRGDGRQYMINLHCPGFHDVTFGNMYSYPLYTHGGPYWQVYAVPFSRFYFNVHGRIMDRQVTFEEDGFNVNSLGITIADRVDGPFRLELDWIGVYFDQTHFETYAYEEYRMPVQPLYTVL